MPFQDLVETVKLINASTHTIDVVLNSPLGRHKIHAEPLGVVEVPKNWTEKGLDRFGKPTIRSTVEQELPFLVDSKHPNVALAKAALEAGKEFPVPQTEKKEAVQQHHAPPPVIVNTQPAKK